MGASGLDLRSVTDGDWAQMVRLDATNFGHVVDPSALAAWRTLIPDHGALVVADGPDVVGQSLYADLQLTVPGGAVLPVAGITWVSVAPTHRRRGLLRAMFTELHDRIAAAGLPVAALTASEGGIYGRFGYGPATVRHEWAVDRRLTRFRSDAPDAGGVRIVTPSEHLDAFTAVYDRWRRITPGGLARPRALWDDLFADRDEDRAGGSPLFAFLHADGYVLYRNHGAGPRHVRVVDFKAATPEAHVALWRALCGMDLMERIEIGTHPADPLPYLLTDGRVVRTTGAADDLWLRLMDIPAALQARTYDDDLSVVLEVDDAFRGDGGRFALQIRDGRAVCAPTGAAPDVTLDLDVLGALYLGGHRATAFAAANRLRTNDSDTVRRIDRAFASAVPAELGFAF
ncbi:enhanced intracellular survival protein Eis [Mycolicibacterium litorale]|uniref:enhanced intracellular survival protein Eis n=1 Tax=Mycolicibacterium litorale TaxID=758802 RepID=UPI001066F38C|nr:enhanced intracellular survival protein Eis [Mycolicibacterium litorale]MCV7414873.1 enhanced intracellular survival protein Eis [Mycolicibacterium litorale]TDY08120.1 putative acetyltransferase [Mycolicibacterium litorale]